MSAVPPQQSGLPDYERWKCDDQRKKVRVHVSDGSGDSVKFIEIPTVEVETTVKSRGISFIDRITRVRFPIEWRGERVTDIISSWSGTSSGDGYDVAKVYWKDEYDSWHLVHTGYIRGVSGEDHGVGRLYIQGYEAFVKELAAAKRFDSAEAKQVGDYVFKELDRSTRLDRASFGVSVREITEQQQRLLYLEVDDAGQQVVDDPSIVDRVQVSTALADVDDSLLLNISSIGTQYFLDTDISKLVASPVAKKKTFKSNRDTLKDVLDWYCEVSDAVWYFDATGDLVIDRRPDDNRLSFIDDRFVPDTEIDFTDRGESSRSLGLARVSILENGALQEIAPINSIVVKGDNSRSLGGLWEGFAKGGAATSIEEAKQNAKNIKKGAGLTNEYPVAAAWYPPLMATDDVEMSDLLDSGLSDGPRVAGIGSVIESNDHFEDGAESHAKSVLQDKVGTEGEGTIVVRGKPQINPKDTMNVLPVRCYQARESDVMTYDVNEVTHHQKNAGPYETEVQVDVHVNPVDIETDSKTLKVTKS